MPFPFKPAATAILTLTLALLSTSVSQGVLLVYEGFQGYSGNMSSATPNEFTVGLDTFEAYGGSTVANYTVNGSSISFGSNFATSGGSISVNGVTGVAAATLDIGDTPYTGTLYHSYLVRITTRSTAAAGDGGGTRVASGVDPTGERFLALADSRNNSTQVAIGYDGGAANSTAVGNSLSTNTNYLIIARFNGVGSSGSQTGSIFAFNLAQYDAFRDAGGTESVLDSLTVAGGGLTAKGSDTGTLTEGFESGDFVHFVSVANVVQYDEMRYGSTLADVIPIPEPSGISLLAAVSGVAILVRRRYRRA